MNSLNLDDRHGYIYLLATVANPKFSTEFVREEEIRNEILELTSQTLSKHKADQFLHVTAIAEQFLSDLRSSNALEKKATARAGEYVKFVSSAYGSFRSEVLKASEIFAEFQQIGSRYFPDAFAAIEAGGSKQKGRVPASDRVVLRSDNEKAADSAIRVLDEIETELTSGSNEVGQAFGDDKDIALKEVTVLRDLVQQTRIRAETTLDFGKKTLGWIIDKAGGSVVGDLAKRALKILIDWLAS